ncbi:2468_t:CDS:2, partial [Ambispora leptoticha]
MTSLQTRIKYLKSLPAIRERSQKVFETARADQLHHFEVNFSQLDNAVDLVISLIRRDYADLNSIPPHSRWRHFEVDGHSRVQRLIDNWESSGKLETARRILDLFVVSVLLDAGAGNAWSYHEKETGQIYKRSEGLAIASLYMFKNGSFSSDNSQPHRVDAQRLKGITVDEVAKAFQVNETTNPLDGLEGRANLLSRLGKSLDNHPEFFKLDDNSPPRPGNLVDYLLAHPTTKSNSI